MTSASFSVTLVQINNISNRRSSAWMTGRQNQTPSFAVFSLG